VEDLGATLVRYFLGIWEAEQSGGGFVILLRSAASNEFAAGRMREVFATQVVPALSRAGGPGDAAARAGLVASQLLGLALGRYILRVPPLLAMSAEEIVANVGPTIQRYAAGADPRPVRLP
jgi:hypothetical protein